MFTLSSQHQSTAAANKNRRLPLILTLVLLMLTLAACGPDPGAGESGTVAADHDLTGEPIKIGLIVPLTGPFAVGGQRMADGLTLGIEEVNAAGGVNGRPLEMLLADSQGKVDEARNQAHRLLDREQVVALIGVYLSEETAEVMELAADRQIPLLTITSTPDELASLYAENPQRYRYIFGVGYDTPQWARLMGDFLIHRGISNYTYVGHNQLWSRHLLAPELKKHLAAADIHPLAEHFYASSQPVFDPIIQDLQDNPPEIIVIGEPSPNGAELVKRLRQSGLDTPVFSLGGALGDEGAARSIEPLGELYFQGAAWDRPGTAAADFFAEFRRRGYEPAGYGEVLTHDAALILAQALTDAASTDGSDLAAALEAGEFEAMAGTYVFGPDHNQALWQAGTQLSGVVVQWTKTGSQAVWPE